MVKQVEREMLGRLRPFHTIDEKIKALEERISSKPEAGKKGLYYRKIFEDLASIEEECKQAKLNPQLTILRYNLYSIEKKILDSITQEVMEEVMEEEEKELR